MMGRRRDFDMKIQANLIVLRIVFGVLEKKIKLQDGD